MFVSPRTCREELAEQTGAHSSASLWQQQQSGSQSLLPPRPFQARTDYTVSRAQPEAAALWPVSRPSPRRSADIPLKNEAANY